MKLLEKLRNKKMKKLANKTEIKFNKNIMQDIQSELGWKDFTEKNLNEKDVLEYPILTSEEYKNAAKKSYERLMIAISEINNELMLSAEIEEREKQFLIHNLMYIDGEIDADYEEEYDDYPSLEPSEEKTKKAYKNLKLKIKTFDEDVLTTSGEKNNCNNDNVVDNLIQHYDRLIHALDKTIELLNGISNLLEEELKSEAGCKLESESKSDEEIKAIEQKEDNINEL